MRKVLNALVCGILIGVCVLFVILRFTNLSSNPQGFFVDESSTAFNAYSILKTGKDEHGVFLPVFFEAFGEFKNPLYIYSQIPLIQLLGFNVDSARGTSAIWGLLTIIIFASFLKFQKFNLLVILFGVALFLASPWHFILSRIAFEVIVYPFFLVLAIFSLWIFQRNERFSFRYFIFFAASLGFSFYSYTSARLLSPLLFITACLIFYRSLSIKKILIALVLFGSFMLPAVVWEYFHPGSLGARYEVVGLSHYSSGLFDFIFKFSSQYIAHLGPDFLLNRADGNFRHSLVWHSTLLWSTLPFFLVGISFSIKKHSRFLVWSIVAMFISFVPSALTIQSPHALRAIGFLPFAVYFIVLGANWFFERIRLYPIFFIIVAFFIWESFSMVFYFDSNYREISSAWFDKDAYVSLEVATQLSGKLFLSPKLYPGTLETAKFLTGRNNAAEVVDPLFFKFPGIYVLTSEHCYNQNVVFTTASTCVVDFK